MTDIVWAVSGLGFTMFVMGLRQVRSPLDSRIARWAPVPLRLIVGYGFMEHGFAKLGRGPEAILKDVADLRNSVAHRHAIFVTAPFADSRTGNRGTWQTSRSREQPAPRLG
jgi:hypothetical protein